MVQMISDFIIDRWTDSSRISKCAGVISIYSTNTKISQLFPTIQNTFYFGYILLVSKGSQSTLQHLKKREVLYLFYRRVIKAKVQKCLLILNTQSEIARAWLLALLASHSTHWRNQSLDIHIGCPKTVAPTLNDILEDIGVCALLKVFS